MSDHEPRRLSLLRLSLRNFKGVRDFVLEPDGADASIFGDNAAGKTTLADAFSWLLFGKDSSGATSFEIKTLGEDGEPVHGLEHEVAATLLLPDGEVLELRKVFEEKWTKKRGAAEKVFDGHTTNHFVDGVPVKMSEYQEAVAQIADEEVFRLLTDPMHFPERLHWTDRRELLLEVCGDVTDEDVIASDPGLEELPEILGKRTLEDHRKVIDARRKEINRELDRIPVRIQEVERGLPEIADGDDEDALRARLQELREQRAAAEEERSTITAGGQAAAKRKALAELQAEIVALRTQVREGTDEGVAELRSDLRQLEADIGGKEREQANLQSERDLAAKKLHRLEVSIEGLRQRWHDVDAETFEHDAEETCPTCGQDIPAEQLQEAHDKALASFNTSKAERLEEIDGKGKELREEHDAIVEAQRKRQAEIDELQQTIAEQKEQAEQFEVRIQEATETEPEEPDELVAKRKEAEALEAEIEKLQGSSTQALVQARQRIAAIDDEIQRAESAMSKHEQRAVGETRIQELAGQERKLAGELEEIERQIHMAETFVRAKVSLLEDRINSDFALAEFRLFREQVNGGLQEVCEVSYRGVPWSSLNHGARVQVGLDVIRTLQRHFEIAPPVFVDQGESVTSLPEMGCQLIRLVVSEDDPELRVETSQKRQAQAA